MPQQLKKARFIGGKENLKHEIVHLDNFPFYSYIGDDGLPVLFSDDEYKESLFKECEEYGIEVIGA